MISVSPHFPTHPPQRHFGNLLELCVKSGIRVYGIKAYLSPGADLGSKPVFPLCDFCKFLNLKIRAILTFLIPKLSQAVFLTQNSFTLKIIPDTAAVIIFLKYCCDNINLTLFLILAQKPIIVFYCLNYSSSVWLSRPVSSTQLTQLCFLILPFVHRLLIS